MNRASLTRYLFALATTLTAQFYVISAYGSQEPLPPGTDSNNPALSEPHKSTDKNAQDHSIQLSRTALYKILAGEFATYRGQYDQALDFYLQQARFYQSAYLSERAARLALNQKRYPELLMASLTWSQASPDDTSATFFLSLAYAYDQQYEQALSTMDRVATSGHKTDFTRLVHLIKEPEHQQQQLQQLLILSQAHPLNFDIQLATAVLSMTVGNKKQALQYTDRAVNTVYNNDRVYFYAARIYISLDHPEKAMKMYKQAVINYPNNQELRLKYAQLATRFDLILAATEFEILRTQAPDDTVVLLNLGLIYLDREEVDLAHPMFEQLLQLNEHIDASHYYLGQIANTRGHDDKALQHFHAVADGPELARAKERISAILLKQHRYDEAQVIIEHELAQAYHPSHIERLNILKAQLLQDQGLTDKAYEHLSLQLSSTPDSIDIRYNRAMLAEMQNNLLQMERDLRHIISIQPDSILALNALGYTLANKTNRLDEALELIQQALELSPQDPAVLDSMGWVLYRMGQWQEALKYLQQAMQQLPDSEVAAHLAEVLWMLGQKEDATVVLKEALLQTPDHNELNETIRRLEIPL